MLRSLNHPLPRLLPGFFLARPRRGRPGRVPGTGRPSLRGPECSIAPVRPCEAIGFIRAGWASTPFPPPLRLHPQPAEPHDATLGTRRWRHTAAPGAWRREQFPPPAFARFSPARKYCEESQFLRESGTAGRVPHGPLPVHLRQAAAQSGGRCEARPVVRRVKGSPSHALPVPPLRLCTPFCISPPSADPRIPFSPANGVPRIRLWDMARGASSADGFAEC